jgi:hypothetical protein
MDWIWIRLFTYVYEVQKLIFIALASYFRTVSVPWRELNKYKFSTLLSRIQYKLYEYSRIRNTDEVLQIRTLTCEAAEESEDAQVPQGGEGGRRVPPLHPEISALNRVQAGPQANAAHKKPGSSYFWERILPQEWY